MIYSVDESEKLEIVANKKQLDKHDKNKHKRRVRSNKLYNMFIIEESGALERHAQRCYA
jgi:hypothetical protein